jgi:hypothetical protein
MERDGLRDGFRITAGPEVIGSRVRLAFALSELPMREIERPTAVEAEPGAQDR